MHATVSLNREEKSTSDLHEIWERLAKLILAELKLALMGQKPLHGASTEVP